MAVLYAGRCFTFQMASNHQLVGHFIINDGLNATVHSYQRHIIIFDEAPIMFLLRFFDGCHCGAII
jgi:hypothetical protein